MNAVRGWLCVKQEKGECLQLPSSTPKPLFTACTANAKRIADAATALRDVSEGLVQNQT